MTEPVEKCGNGQHVKGCQTRQRIIDTAAAIIIEEGRPGLTTRAICEKAGIGKGSLYHHFKDTHEVIREVMLSFMEHYFGEMEHQSFTGVGDFFRRTGRSAINETLEHMNIRERFLAFAEEIYNDRQLLAALIERHLAFRTALGVRLEELSGGRLPAAVRDNAVLAVLTFIEGMESLLQFDREVDRYRAMWDMTATLLTDYVEKNIERRTP